MTGNAKTIVSYNMVGAPYLGALDYFTKLLNKTPKLSSSMSATNSEASAVFTDGGYAYAAGTSSDPTFPFPATLQRIRVSSDRFDLAHAGNMYVPLTSFVATSTMATNNHVYATTGNTGHVFAFDDNSMSLVGQYALADARWVAWDNPGNRVVVLQGMPGRLAVFQENSFPGGSMTLLNTWNVPGVDVAEAKNAFEIAGGKAFVATGPQGVQIVCLATGAIIGNVPRPSPASVGLPDAVVQTNSVTIKDDLMFISNGEAGVYAAAGSRDFDDNSCNPYTITVLGQLRFSNLQSVNHVMYRDNHLFVAAGLGGIKVVDVDVSN
jgi:outer membrane protein assembly factor BamB